MQICIFLTFRCHKNVLQTDYSSFISAPCSPACLNGGTCLTNNKCRCPRWYIGARCQLPVCKQSCLNGGKCIKPNVCLCNTKWLGNRCEKPVCLFPCLNKGRCVSPNKCACQSGFYGKMCEKGMLHVISSF